MKTQIQFQQTDGDNGIALVDASVNTLDQAKRELADKLDLPGDAGVHSNIDKRLRDGGIDPSTITFSQIVE